MPLGWLRYRRPAAADQCSGIPAEPKLIMYGAAEEILKIDFRFPLIDSVRISAWASRLIRVASSTLWVAASRMLAARRLPAGISRDRLGS